MSINRFAHSNENAAFPFPPSYFNCRCSIKEELKMSKYIPKVGDFVLSDLGTECKVLHVGKESLFVESDSEEFSADFDYFQPMPKKVDIERKILLDILNKEESFKFSVASEIQKAGFTIPKRFTKEDITTAIYGRNSGMDNAVCVAHVCELLGDLVED